MNKQSLFFTVIVAIVAFIIMLLAIQYLTKKMNIKNDSSQKVNTSFSIWVSSLLVSFFIFLKIALEQVENSIEIIIKSESIDNTFFSVMQKITIFMGFTFLYTFLCYYLIDKSLQFVLGKRINNIEIEKENVGYFLIKGISLLLFVYSVSFIFEHFLKWFMPVVEMPFYH
ncbi:hypothetical protein ACFPVY_00770 [Flavobacterium qiangtangense]|uniref:DUF4234 domain-containing protein n=1 Tax=Flavobacterium qiangtangense TaxID=1442595 RepID=A0ABW1PJB2_9FLAO